MNPIKAEFQMIKYKVLNFLKYIENGNYTILELIIKSEVVKYTVEGTFDLIMGILIE
jgi:hypothetical protein